ncbi:hypothetical protein [uncultured Varibaculum sp.]|uniref:hypothetical protein n=1 Tax=uncultured Varibaculum sp. TaxID=413896 RepID=UPI002595417C|nr:hypothetical protein [uncultured Varibaculum sp.]
MCEEYGFEAWLGKAKDELTQEAYDELFELWCEADELFEMESAKDDEPREIDTDAINAFLTGATEFACELSKPASDSEENHAAAIMREAGAAWTKARSEYEAARLQMYGAVKFAATCMNRNQIIKNSGMSPNTVYRILDAERLS